MNHKMFKEMHLGVALFKSINKIQNLHKEGAVS